MYKIKKGVNMMTEVYDISKFPYLDSMHDLKISKIELMNESVVLRYENITLYESNYVDGSTYYFDHKDFRSCEIVFKNGQDSYAEIRHVNKLNIRARKYYIDDFIKYIDSKKYMIETLYFYYGYNTVVINGVICDTKGCYHDRCIITIPTTEVIYNWN
jgi:hypothetical protein